MHLVCCGCHREVSNENAKNILNDDLVIEYSDCIDIAGPISTQIVKLRVGIELITGDKVPKAANTAVLCTTCCQRIESFMIFRMQLLASLEKLSKPVPDTGHLQSFVHHRNIIAVLNDYKLSEPNITVDYDVNTNDFLGSNKLLNDEENNNLNDSENSNEVQDVIMFKELVKKVEKVDIESEIDIIYFGESDEIVELAVPIRKIDLVDLTGSESETEACDYEPIEKNS